MKIILKRHAQLCIPARDHVYSSFEQFELQAHSIKSLKIPVKSEKIKISSLCELRITNQYYVFAIPNECHTTYMHTHTQLTIKMK